MNLKVLRIAKMACGRCQKPAEYVSLFQREPGEGGKFFEDLRRDGGVIVNEVAVIPICGSCVQDLIQAQEEHKAKNPTKGKLH